MFKSIYVIIFFIFIFSNKVYPNNSYLGLDKSGLPFSLKMHCNENSKKIKIKEKNLLIFNIKNTQIGNCKSSKKDKRSKLFVETLALIKDKNHELIFEFKPEKGMEGVSFLKLEDWTPKCKNEITPFALRFNQYGNIEAGFRSNNDKIYYKTQFYLRDYINKWNTLHLKIRNLNQDKINLKILINDEKIFKGKITNNICNEYKVAFGIDEQMKVSSDKFHFISYKNFKLLSGPITKCNFIENYNRKLNIMLVGDSQIDNGNEFKCNVLAAELSYNLKNSIDVFVKGGSGYVSKDIKLNRAKSFKQLTKNKDLSNYDWVIWISGADLNSFRESKNDELIKRVDKIISKDLKKGYLIDTFNFNKNKNTNFIISLTTDMSQNLKMKKYTRLINSGQKLIERYREVAASYENVFFIPIQDFVDKDNKILYTDRYDGVHYSNKAMKILAKPISKIIIEN